MSLSALVVTNLQHMSLSTNEPKYFVAVTTIGQQTQPRLSLTEEYGLARHSLDGRQSVKHRLETNRIKISFPVALVTALTLILTSELRPRPYV